MCSALSVSPNVSPDGARRPGPSLHLRQCTTGGFCRVPVILTDVALQDGASSAFRDVQPAESASLITARRPSMIAPRRDAAVCSAGLPARSRTATASDCLRARSAASWPASVSAGPPLGAGPPGSACSIRAATALPYAVYNSLLMNRYSSLPAIKKRNGRTTIMKKYRQPVRAACGGEPWAGGSGFGAAGWTDGADWRGPVGPVLCCSLLLPAAGSEDPPS